jgi:DNA-binding transcriptional ArsR family regulator
MAEIADLPLEEETRDTLAALADANRLRILFLLGGRERLCVSEISQHFTISRPAVSHHLKVLRSAGIARGEKVGREVYYRADFGSLAAALRSVADTIECCCVPPETESRDSEGGSK